MSEWRDPEEKVRSSPWRSHGLSFLSAAKSFTLSLCMRSTSSTREHRYDGLNGFEPWCTVQGYLALFSGDTGEIKVEVREQINKKVRFIFSFFQVLG